MNKEQYVAQVTLLLDCLTALKDQQLFALKGGTAINFFICDLPRLSVDIDLTYLKKSQRSDAITEIGDGLRAIGQSIIERRNLRIFATSLAKAAMRLNFKLAHAKICLAKFQYHLNVYAAQRDPIDVIASRVLSAWQSSPKKSNVH